MYSIILLAIAGSSSIIRIFILQFKQIDFELILNVSYIEEENKVSVWIGTLNNEEQFKNYIKVYYNDNGEQFQEYLNTNNGLVLRILKHNQTDVVL